MSIAVRRAIAVATVIVGGLLFTAVPGQAADDVKLFPHKDVEKICHDAGGTFSGNEYGFTCTLPNGDQLWCDYIARVCGFTDRGKPAPKKDKRTHAQLLSKIRVVPAAR